MRLTRWLKDLVGTGEQTYRRYHERLDRPRRIRARVLAVLTIVSGAVYLWWLTGNLSEAGGGGMSVGFVAAEVIALLVFVIATVDFWGLRYKRPEGLDVEEKYDVDVFIPTAGEELRIVAPVLRAASNIRWEHGDLTVWVLDDGGSTGIRRLAEQLGHQYRSRAESDVGLGADKAGNLNFGLEAADGDLVLVLDADQVPKPDILERMAGYMRFEDLAFIQSRQVYRVPEGDPLNNQDELFYEAAQLGLDNENAVISCGSGVLYRRSALDDIGGFATWNLVEDLTTSYELHSRGWKSFYYPYALSVGLAPNSIAGVYRQRGKWALDTMRLFFWDNPLLKRGAPWRVRLTYLMVPLTYLLAGFLLPFFFVVPLWSYVTGINVLSGPEWQFVAIRGAYFLAMVGAIRYMFRRRSPGKQFQFLVGLFPVYLSGTVRALFYPPNRRPEYELTNVGREERRERHPVRYVWPQVLLFVAHLVLPFVALLLDWASARLVIMNAFVSVFALWALWPVIGNSVQVYRDTKTGEVAPSDEFEVLTKYLPEYR